MEGRSRAIVERVRPEIDAGRFPIKRTVGQRVAVDAHVFTDGHDVVAAVLRHRNAGETQWREVEMTPLYNDEWTAEFVVDQLGACEYTVVAWVDRFFTWHRDFQKRAAANQAARVDLLIGAELIADAAKRAAGSDRVALESWAARLSNVEAIVHTQQVCEDSELPRLMKRHPDRSLVSEYDRVLSVSVERERAGFSTWYEMFPRSAASEPGRHGTLADVEARLPYVAAMGFDVLYLPPIHPIGRKFRKGKNNVTTAERGDVGSPWGIGSSEGGHKAIHPDLGTIADFRRLVKAAQHRGIELALDVALQCAPDHPYVQDHPDWFRQRPDGTIQYAENPPKKYQDIYPFDFECRDWRALWDELKSIFDYWIAEGVKIFRVDNPHTKPFAFWEWCLGEIRREHPDVLFLAEAFTRPKIMYRLAKLGFTQSYTYFAWRNTKQELTEYMAELTKSNVHEFFYPNFWPNTPDILTEYLQVGGRPAFMARLVLAATLSPNYGIYGPPFEHCWTAPREPGSEEYRDSEKYQIHYHDLDRPDSLRDFIARVNEIRREQTVLRTLDNVHFHAVDNDQLICYTKSSPDKRECLLVVVNLDPHHTQSGWIDLPLEALDVDDEHPYQVHDLLSDARYLWNGRKNFVQLDPHVPAHIFQVRRRVRSERDFEYYL
ncbi:MAG: alpha-1,4-glucan--maltose-1-phosphate maltosyltransferase [Planctomycetota bacterium]|nr:MAG: alpha-1,4-glucan--maltose-1-phosphate maltosyltransferase [Planctomycetota bacterium]